MANPRYFWLKLFESYYADDAIGWLLEQRQKDFSTIFLQICLLTMNTDGYLALKINGTLQPYPTPLIAKRIQTDLESTQKALTLLMEVGKIIMKNDLPFIPDVVHMVGSETKDAARKRKSRTNTKNLSTLEHCKIAAKSDNKIGNIEKEGRTMSAQHSGHSAESVRQRLDIREREKIITIHDIKTILKNTGMMATKIDELAKNFTITEITDAMEYVKDFEKQHPQKNIGPGFLVHCIENRCKLSKPLQTHYITCPACHGQPKIVIDKDGYETVKRCEICRGTGKIKEDANDA